MGDRNDRHTSRTDRIVPDLLAAGVHIADRRSGHPYSAGHRSGVRCGALDICETGEGEELSLRPGDFEIW